MLLDAFEWSEGCEQFGTIIATRKPVCASEVFKMVVNTHSNNTW